MDSIIRDIVAAIARGETPDNLWLTKLLKRHHKGVAQGEQIGKRELLPYYLAARAKKAELWQSWDIDDATDTAILRLLQMKPRRTASGVATITVITKPYPCSSNCIYCPNDIRMPKSYLADEPACQRALQNYFDPYLQVCSRMATLDAMGHLTDKIELIILGGTWSDYPLSYQLWFVSELFRALNDSDRSVQAELRRKAYEALGYSRSKREHTERLSQLQEQVNAGALSYNQARSLIDVGTAAPFEGFEEGSYDALEREQLINESAKSRVVGLCVETRPDLITEESALELRKLGCTKIQMGIQSLDQVILDTNGRKVRVDEIKRAFSVLRLCGFKILIHFMVNLLGSSPASDKADYLKLVNDPAYLPDEVKLYPCVLVESAQLKSAFADGLWQPYSELELVDILAEDLRVTPAYTRISRMIRDISAHDIVAGNKKTNLRQDVDAYREQNTIASSEIRGREISTSDVSKSELVLSELHYKSSVSEEVFLEWKNAKGQIAGFLRLSLPFEEALLETLPIKRAQAMIREVHVYGRVAGIGLEDAGGAQHHGLGRKLISRAEEIAREHSYEALNVISSVGTRNYYRELGFKDVGLYQQLDLTHPSFH